jgi:hypothetical protein
VENPFPSLPAGSYTGITHLYITHKIFRCKINITVRYGSNDHRYAKEVKTKKYAIHPSYFKEAYHDNDFAIVTLPPKSFQFDDGTVNAICIPIGLGNKSFWGRRLTIVGWGRVNDTAYQPQQLQKACMCMGVFRCCITS